MFLFLALFCLCLKPVNCRPTEYEMGDPFYVPVPLAFPGGRGVNFLSHQTEAFGDEMSSRISEQSREVGNLGDEIQQDTREQSQQIEDIGREVDADESIPFPASQAADEFLGVDEDDGEGNGYNSWPTEER